ncbi:MAG: 1-(5-phosphoribosyl)-5-[(5-phosphoribosylamino)methylideneamino] imidazole-4-carboxamide isomerase [Proteobacteria bacterium]|nr:1-(5-phosphoribosyl)-5-[(5-phosphoribosylamino)methylideneamino] imidazole-4-carboxamide isomerase [Pseudomonadota bacterium]
MQLLPAMDLIGGRVVRLRQGDFGQASYYPRTPAAQLQQYAALGAAWAHVVDLDAARTGLANPGRVRQLCSGTTLKVQVGGGVRSHEDLAALLDGGAARVVVGSAASERPGEVAAWLRHFGGERLCLAFDVRLDESGVPRVHTRGWQERTALSLWAALERYPPMLVRHVLCTDIARDGELAGPNLELYAAAVGRFPHIQWQASGGVRNALDLAALARSAVSAAVCGKALLEARIQPQELRPFWPDASFPASTSATAP